MQFSQVVVVLESSGFLMIRGPVDRLTFHELNLIKGTSLVVTWIRYTIGLVSLNTK